MKNFNVRELLDSNFEAIEKSVFEYICDMGKQITVYMLEQLDEYLMKYRNRKRYQSKQIRKTTIKTVYGEVEYNRRMYYDKEKSEYIYLLDDKLQMERVGTISTNLAKRIAEASINMPFRKAADTITANTGQCISSHGVWNVVQNIGDVIQAEEQNRVEQLKSEDTKGCIESKVIFMEADGVYLNIQENKQKAKSRELKLSTIYDGWDNDGKSLHNKKVYAGMEPAKKFNEKTEALLQSVFDIDATDIRIVNGDGATWIKDTYEPDRVFQLDRFHIQQEIIRCIPEDNVRYMIMRCLEEHRIDDMLDAIQTYINSIDEGRKSKKLSKAKKLYQYLSNNYEGLLPWQLQIKTIPEAPEGLVYKNLGTQENQNCSLVCMRMKGRKMRWSVEGANNLAKLIYFKENGDLEQVIENNRREIYIPSINVERVLSSNKIKETVGRGSRWSEPSNSVPILQTAVGNKQVKVLSHISNYL